MIVQLMMCITTWYLCRMTVFSHWPPIRTALAHIVASVMLTGLWLLLILFYVELLVSVSKNEMWRTYYDVSLPLFIAVGLSLYFISILTHYLVLILEKQRKAESEAYEQKILAGRAELKALKSTVHPHFLFNSLNLLGPLMKSSQQKAGDVVSRLSDFLVYSLRYGKHDRVTIKDEVDHVKNYLGIEAVRLGDRLSVDIEVDETLYEIPMLPLILLPLVENAVKHGISQRLDGGRLTMTVKKKQEDVLITLSNPYDEPSRPLRGEGMGIETVKQRIKAYYGAKAQLKTINDEEAQTYQVELRFPMVRADE